MKLMKDYKIYFLDSFLREDGMEKVFQNLYPGIWADWIYFNLE